MKHVTKSYVTLWAILLIAFNAVAFISPGWIAYEKYTASFWIGYVFITISFVGQLLCSLKALKAENLTKLFYNIPIIRISYAGLIASFVVGGVCMLISPLPYWIGALLAIVVLALTALSVVKATAAAELVADIDEKVSKQTFFIKNLTVEAETLIARANTSESKAMCKKVYEALRYSDPMSNQALGAIERKIEKHFSNFSETLSSDAANELLLLIEERNRKCKLNK